MGLFAYLMLFNLTVIAWAGPQPLDCQTSSPLDDNHTDDFTAIVSEVNDQCSIDDDEGGDKKKNKDSKNSKVDMSQFCEVVANKLINKKGQVDGNNEKPYLYLKLLAKAACVNPTDSEAVQNEKIQKYWDLNYTEILKCSSFELNLTDVSVSRIAVKSEFINFIKDIASWGVDFNKPDPSDGLTLLEFINKERDKTTDRNLKSVLNYYHKVLSESLEKKKKNI